MISTSGLRPDAAAADERVPAAEPEGSAISTSTFEVVDWGTDAGGVAQPADRAAGARRRRREHQPGMRCQRRCSRYYLLRQHSRRTDCNWGHWNNPEFDELLRQAQSRRSTRTEEIEAASQQAHEIIVDEAAWLFIVHDLNPRAMTKKVQGFTSRRRAGSRTSRRSAWASVACHCEEPKRRSNPHRACAHPLKIASLCSQ